MLINYSKQAIKFLNRQDKTMSAVKERILGAVTVMSDIEAERIWNMIIRHFSADWDSVEAVTPDEWDKKMLDEIKADPDCKTFVSAEDAMKELGLA